MSLYDLEGVRVAHGGRTVLDVTRLRLEPCRTYSLQGSNGAGKSTLLGILAFLHRPNAGDVRFEERPVRWVERDLRVLRTQVGFVEQHPVMFSCSVAENVGFGLKLRGYPEREIRDRVGKILEQVGLAHLAAHHAPCLSGGETQRVAIARALVCEPRVLLLDEPTASVDVQNRIIIEHVVAELRDRGETTIVLCTHNRFQAWSLCPEVICLDEGKLASRPQTNVFACRFQHVDGRTRCRVAEGFEIAVSNSMQGRGRVVIDPDKVRVTKVVEPGLNRGRVIRARLEGQIVSLTVDLGLPLSVHMGFADFRRLGLSIGDLVMVEIGPDAVESAQGLE